MGLSGNVLVCHSRMMPLANAPGDISKGKKADVMDGIDLSFGLIHSGSLTNKQYIHDTPATQGRYWRIGGDYSR